MGSEVNPSGPRVFLGADCTITSAGGSTAGLISTIEAGRCACRQVSDATLWESTFVAGKIEADAMPRTEGCTPLEGLFIAVISDVLARSGVDPAAEDTLLVVSSTKGNIELLSGEGPRDERVLPGTMARRIAARTGFRNTPVVISNACISGVSAIVVSSRLIRRGAYRNVVVAGGDLLTRFVVSGFHAFRSVSGQVCRPYDAARDGLTLGEGCGALLLTADPSVAIRPLVELTGGAMSGDANHISGPSRTGDGLFFAIRSALDEAAVDPAEVDFVNGHGTGTIYNDEMESRAFALAGLDGARVNGLKPYFGHTLGAAGVVETIVCAHALRSGVVYGTPGFGRTGTPHPLDASCDHRPSGGGVCLKTASGFGGCNAALVLRRTDDENDGKADRTESHTASLATDPAPAIRQSASVEIVPDGRPFAEMIRERFRALDSADVKFFRMDDLSKLACVAAAELLRRAGFTDDRPIARKYPPHRIGIVAANRSGSLDTDTRHCKLLESTGEASPAVFVYTLPNVAVAEISIRHKIQGEQTFFIEDEPGPFPEQYAHDLIRCGQLDAVIVGRLELADGDFSARLTLLETN